MDDPKKKKLDSKRIALKQKHEVAYLKKIAREQLGIINDLRGKDLKLRHISIGVNLIKLERICKALLKCLR